MKSPLYTTLTLGMATTIAAAAAAAAAPPTPGPCENPSGKPAAFFLAGDSTTAVQAENGGGWGDGFISYLTPPAQGSNFGRNGRTTVDYVSQGHWADMTAAASRAVAEGFDAYVTIQFGHNDQKPDKGISLDDYQANLVRLAGEVRDLGATPILVTPLTRRNFRSEHETDDSLREERVRTMAAAEEGEVTWIDLYLNSKTYVEALGEERAHEFNLKEGDNTHLNARGSVVFGRMVADMILEKEGCLAEWIEEDRELSDEIWDAIGGGKCKRNAARESRPLMI